ncbi:MAG TPA: IS110 family transposase [Chloroflexota bacterium]|nr:IS110 family transposase [Chloroflexota bacterium]
MAIVGGFDVHRAQITYDYLDTDSGEIATGQIRPATRQVLRSWLERFTGREDVAFAVEGCTGWRFVVEELVRASVQPHLAEPADTATQRGRKKRAKTDRTDARLLRELLTHKRLPESWIPPAHMLEVRTLSRLYVALMDERRAWQQRIHAQLFHQGSPVVSGLLTAIGQSGLEHAKLSPAGRQMVQTALATIASLNHQIEPLRAQLQAIGLHQPAVRALAKQYGIGLLSGTIIWAELGDCRRFKSSDQVVRFAGLDVTVWSSDGKRSAGHLARQGSPELRWALYEAAKCAARSTSPDQAYYVAVRDRLDGKQATLSVARKLARRCYHALRELADEVCIASTYHRQEAA